MRIENRNVRLPVSFHNLGFVVPMPVLLELSIGACACACVCMCREGALDGLDFFLKKTPQKPNKQMGLFLLFMPVANYKADPQGLRFSYFTI